MQKELDAENLPVRLQLAGVNEAGHERDNPVVCNGKDLPWLQESAAMPVWTAWQVTYRDVIILNGNNEPEGIYNLTTHDLGNTAHYEELKSLLRQISFGVADAR